MAMIDRDYYNDQFNGTDVPEKAWARYERVAEDLIKDLCNGYFDNHDLADLKPVAQERVKRAICAQIEWFQDLGGTTINEQQASQQLPQSVSVGNFTLNTGSGQTKSTTPGSSRFDPRVTRYLWPTGLLYRGVGQYG